MSEYYGCRICGSAYTGEQIREDGVSNRCCQGNLVEIGEEEYEKNKSSGGLLEQTKEDPPQAPEEFQGIEDRGL